MHIYISKFTESGIRNVAMVHKGATINWDTPLYTKASRLGVHEPNPDDDVVFKEFNGLLASLPEDAQERIWIAYNQFHTLMDQMVDPLHHQGDYQDCVSAIYREIPYETAKRWVAVHGVVDYPSSLKTEYGPKDPPVLTYLRDDYFDLVVLAILLRGMLPLWGCYINRSWLMVSNADKEYIGGQLIYKTYLPQCKPYLRLREYMEATIASRCDPGVLASFIHGGISSDSFPDWLLANTIVRRTAVVPIRTTMDGPNIITDVFQFVKTAMLPSAARKFAGPITEKHSTSDDDGDNPESTAEIYKMKQRISDGDLVMSQYCLSDVVVNARLIEPTVTMECLEACVKSIETIQDEPIAKHQTVLTQWTMAPCVSPRIVPIVNRIAQMQAMATTMAVLWTWGFYNLAGLMAARALPRDTGEYFSGVDIRSSKLSPEVCKELETIYPYPMPIRAKNPTFRQSNVGYISVDRFLELIHGTNWVLEVPEALRSEASTIHGSSEFLIPPNLNEEVAQLLVKLYASRQAIRARLAR